MKILILKTGEITTCSDSLALRKIEQGKAVPVIRPVKKPTRAKPGAGDA